MPGFNQTGPAGQGPMTGRRMGQCAQRGANDQQRNQNQNQNQNAPNEEGISSDNRFGNMQGGFGRGQRGRGLGRRNRLRGGL